MYEEEFGIFRRVFLLFFNIFVSQDEKLTLLMVDFAKVSF